MHSTTRLARLVCVGAACAIVLAACGSAESRKAHSLEKGERYLEAGNLDKARVEFRNALQLAPNDAESRYRNGLVQERLGNISEAAKFYQGAVDVDGDHLAARAALARLYLFAGGTERAMELLKPGLEKHPDNVSLLALRAAARSRLADAPGALADAERAHGLDPKDESAVSVLAGLYTAAGQRDTAEALLVAAVRDHTSSVDLRLALAQLHASANDDAKAEAQLREIVRIAPDQRSHRIRLAQFLSVRGQDAAAEAVLRGAASRFPTDPEVRGSLVDFLAAKRGRPAAEAELQQRVAAARDGDAEPRFALARFYVAGHEEAKAEGVYRDIIAKQGTRPAGLTASDQLAELAMLRGDQPLAAKLIAEVLDSSAHDTAALVLRGDLALARGDAKSAIVDFRAVLRDQPNSAAILRGLARAHAKNGEPALAEETLRRAVDANPADFSSALDLADLLVQTGRPEQARPLLERLANDHPANVPAQTLLFRVSAAAKDFVTARAAADGIIAAQPKAAGGYFFRGTLDESEKHPDAALAQYQRALELQPDAAEPLEAATRLLLARRQVTEALRLLDETAARAPASPAPWALKGEILTADHKFEDAAAALRVAVDRAPRWWVPYRTMAELEIARGDGGRAVAILADAIPKVAEPAKIRAELAGIEESRGHPDAAISHYEQAVKEQPGDLGLANNLAMLLATYRHDPESLARAAGLIRRFAASPSAQYLDTYGWVHLKQGDAVGALPVLEKAEAAAPESAELRYHLAMAQLAAGQRDRAADNLRFAVSKGAPFAGFDDAKAALRQLAANK